MIPEKEKNYLEINKQLWNAKTGHHVNSDFYNTKGFLNGQTSLKEIELPLLGNVKGKRVLHLQCHFGQDSISLARMGAEVTGVDLSDVAIVEAKKLAEATKEKVDFICCDLYSLTQHLEKKFDIVFTSYGTIGWLPDLQKWANVVSRFLRPGGKFVFAEFHPVVWMMDYNFEKITYNYFNSGAIIETESGTYASKEADINLESVSWNHGISEVVNNLIAQGLQICSFNEFDYSPYHCFNNMEEAEPGKFRIKKLENKLPMVYSILAVKP